MSLDRQIIIPANAKKYASIPECVWRWESGEVFQISESGIFCTIRDCCIGDRILLSYRFPNMSKLLYYEFTEAVALRISKKWLDEVMLQPGNHIGVKRLT